MNNDNNTALNNIQINIGKIKHPEFGEVFGGLDINVQLTDESFGSEATTNLQALKLVFPIMVEKITKLIVHQLDKEAAERKERNESIEKENKERLADWEIRVKEYEDRKAKFDKAFKAWEDKKAQSKKGDFFESAPTFYETRPERPHCQTIF